MVRKDVARTMSPGPRWLRRGVVAGAVVVALGATGQGFMPSFADEAVAGRSGQGVDVVLTNLPTTFEGTDLNIKSVRLSSRIGNIDDGGADAVVDLGCVSIAPGEEVPMDTSSQVSAGHELEADYFPEPGCVGRLDVSSLAAFKIVPADADGGDFRFDLARNTRQFLGG